MIERLFENNRAWARNKVEDDPDFFTRLAGQQAPEFLWIGCSDSRVPANQIVGLDPGEVFVHRNVANLVHPADLNCVSVLQFAIESLRVSHVIVCGHYGCGGVRAAMSQQSFGLIDHWLRPIKEVYRRRHESLSAIADEDERLNALCEFSVMQQVRNVAGGNVVQSAWARGQKLAVHGWIYGLSDGLLRDLQVSLSDPEHLDAFDRLAVGG
ncbi:MAG: carbonate dehydratase [Rhodovibrionaceae bacterium]|nr:carbonate dehydratase [Rhodovibrionaceae bacterium]